MLKRYKVIMILLGVLGVILLSTVVLGYHTPVGVSADASLDPGKDGFCGNTNIVCGDISFSYQFLDSHNNWDYTRVSISMQLSNNIEGVQKMFRFIYTLSEGTYFDCSLFQWSTGYPLEPQCGYSSYD